MSDQYISEIRLFGGTFAPVGWFLCDGSLKAVNDYEALFSLIGARYGGDGRTTFAMPDLRGRIPVHPDPSNTKYYRLDQPSGTTTVTLKQDELPAHTHLLQGTLSRGGTTTDPSSAVYVDTNSVPIYNSPIDNLGAMSPNAIASWGQGGSHNNRSPYQVVNFIIAYQGIYPQRS